MKNKQLDETRNPTLSIFVIYALYETVNFSSPYKTCITPRRASPRIRFTSRPAIMLTTSYHVAPLKTGDLGYFLSI